MEKKTGKRVEQKPKQPKKKSRLTGGQKALLALAVCLAVALAAVAGYKNLFVRPDVEHKGDKGPDAEQEELIDYGDGLAPRAEGQRKSQDFYTVLILGRDTGGGGNTDTMLLASYDVTNQKAAVMSIPRDTMVNIPYDVKKINAVYNYGGQGEKGIQALYKEISQLVGFEPDFKVIVEWEAVGKMVDAIGGVSFDVPYNMDYHDPYQDLVIEQEKGCRLLDGDDAMQVIRWRQNDSWSPYGQVKIGDSGRMDIQQDFLKAMIKQLMAPSNVMNIGKIAKVFQECVETDLSFQEILWFGQQAVSGGLSVENVEFFTMPWYGVGAWSRSYQQNLSYVVPNAGELLDIVNNKLSPFVEVFTLSDLDIMSVNSDGSLRSTTGYVEDSKAAEPPVKPEKDTSAEAPEIDENGGLIDPETGVGIPADPGVGDILVIDPETGAVQTPEGTDPEPGGPTPPEDPVQTTPEDPVLPADPETEETEAPADPEWSLVTPEFSIIEPPTAA